MAAYVIGDSQVLDADALAKYRALSQVAVAKYGGKYLVRGGAGETIEGTWKPGVLAILEFPSLEAAHTWYESPEYREARVFARKGIDRDLIFVEGVAKQP